VLIVKLKEELWIKMGDGYATGNRDLKKLLGNPKITFVLGNLAVG
jgi:hypothetical protein